MSIDLCVLLVMIHSFWLGHLTNTLSKNKATDKHLFWYYFNLVMLIVWLYITLFK